MCNPDVMTKSERAGSPVTSAPADRRCGGSGYRIGPLQKRPMVREIGMVVLVVLLASSGARGQTAQTRQVMREKLVQSQQVLSALVRSDWNALGQGSSRLSALTKDPGWAVMREPEYVRETVDFLRSVDALTKAAARRDQGAALSAYTGLVASCVQCHQYVARARIAKR